MTNLQDLRDIIIGLIIQVIILIIAAISNRAKKSAWKTITMFVLYATILVSLGLIYILGKTENQNTQYIKTNPVTPIATYVSELDGMVLVKVPAGDFIMGNDNGDPNEHPAHTVYLDSYWIDQTEVTNRMYAKCVAEGACTKSQYGSYSRDSYFDDLEVYGEHPVVYVSWYQARNYCAWAGRRLPSEAEWEKAARGPNGQKYPWGAAPPSAALLNFDGDDTVRVGSYPLNASPYGAYDMAGNLYEWVADYYAANFYEAQKAVNPTGPQSGSTHVVRGGCFLNDTENFVTTTVRFGLYGENANDAGAGFRCAVSD
jgi:formylglycine-generating enzyme required for sulfatase activity